MAFYGISLKIQSLSQPHAVSVARFGRLDQTVESPLGNKTAFPPTPQTWKKLAIVYVFTLFSISKCTKLGFPDEFLNLQFLAERNIACAVLMMAEQPWFSVGGGKWPTLGLWETRHTSPLKRLVSEGQGQVRPSGALQTSRCRGLAGVEGGLLFVETPRSVTCSVFPALPGWWRYLHKRSAKYEMWSIDMFLCGYDLRLCLFPRAGLGHKEVVAALLLCKALQIVLT